MSSALKIILIACLVLYRVFCAVAESTPEESNEINDICPEYASYYCACSTSDHVELSSVKMCLFPKSQGFDCIPCPAFLQDRINCTKCPKKICPICSLEKFREEGGPENKQSARESVFIKILQDTEDILRLQQSSRNMTSYFRSRPSNSSYATEDIEIPEDGSNPARILILEKETKFTISEKQNSDSGSENQGSEKYAELNRSRKEKVKRTDVSPPYVRKLSILLIPSMENRYRQGKRTVNGTKTRIESTEEHQITKVPNNSPSDKDPKTKIDLFKGVMRIRFSDAVPELSREFLATPSRGIRTQLRADLKAKKSNKFKEESQKIALEFSEMREIQKKDDPFKSSRRDMEYQTSFPVKALSGSNEIKISRGNEFYFFTNNGRKLTHLENNQNGSESFLGFLSELKYVMERNAFGNKKKFPEEYILEKKNPEKIESIHYATGNVGISQAEKFNKKSNSLNFREKNSRVRRNSRNSSTLQADTIVKLGNTENVPVGDSFALSNSENSPLKGKKVDGSAGKIQDVDPRQSSAERILEMKNSGTSQADTIGVEGKSENPTAEDSLASGNSGNTSLKEKVENVGKSQQDANKFVTDSKDKSNSRNSSEEVIIEIINSRTFQAADTGALNNSGNFKVEDLFALGNSEKPSLKEKGESAGKPQQDANSKNSKFVTDSSNQNNSRPSQAANISALDNSGNFKVEDLFALGNSGNSSLEAKGNYWRAGQIQEDTDSKFVTNSTDQSNSRNSSAEGIIEMRNSGESQTDNIGAVGNSENSTAEDSFASGNSENSPLKEKEEKAGKSQQDDNSKNSTFVTDSIDKNDSGYPSAEGIIEMRNSKTFQADDIGAIDKSGIFAAEDSIASSNTENPPLEKRDDAVNENIGKFKQEAKLVTDSSGKSNSRNPSAKGIIEMRNSRTSQAGNIGLDGNSKESTVEVAVLVTDSSGKSNSRNSSAKGIIEMRNSRPSQAGNIGLDGDSEESTVKYLVSGTPETSKTRKNDATTKENAENSKKNFAAKNDTRKTLGGNGAKNNSNFPPTDKSVFTKNLGSFVEDGRTLHNDTSEVVAKIPFLRRLLQFDKTKRNKRVIHFSMNDTALNTRSKRDLPQNDWCYISRGIRHGNLDCTIWTYKKECRLCCHNGYTFQDKKSMVFKCDRKKNKWEPKICACTGAPAGITLPDRPLMPMKAEVSVEQGGEIEDDPGDYSYDDEYSEPKSGENFYDLTGDAEYPDDYEGDEFYDDTQE